MGSLGDVGVEKCLELLGGGKLIRTLDSSILAVRVISVGGTVGGVEDLMDIALSEAVSDRVLVLGFFPFSISLSLPASSWKST